MMHAIYIRKRCLHERSNPEPMCLFTLRFDRRLRHDRYVSCRDLRLFSEEAQVPEELRVYLCDMPMTSPFKVCFAKQRAVLRNEISCRLLFRRASLAAYQPVFYRCDKRGGKKEKERLHT